MFKEGSFKTGRRHLGCRPDIFFVLGSLCVEVGAARGRRGWQRLDAKKALCEEDVGTASEVTTTSFELTFLEHANSDNS